VVKKRKGKWMIEERGERKKNDDGERETANEREREKCVIWRERAIKKERGK
jgi:hypothetical protein